MSLSLYPSPPPSTLADLPDDPDSATRDTLKLMAGLVRQYKTDAGIGTLARQLLAKLPGSANAKDVSAQVTALQHFVRDQIRYVGDVAGVETLQTPLRTLQIRTGDCDDKAILLATLLQTINLPVRFQAVGFNHQSLSHVFTEVRLGTRWIPLETIIDFAEPGWYPHNPPPTSYMLWHVR